MGLISPSLNRWILTLPGWVPYRLQICWVSCCEPVPENILADSMLWKCIQGSNDSFGDFLGAAKILLSPQSPLAGSKILTGAMLFIQCHYRTCHYCGFHRSFCFFSQG